MCGNSENEDDVDILLSNVVVDLIATDPPYMSTDLQFDKDGVTGQWHVIGQKYCHDNAYLVQCGTIETLFEATHAWSLRFSGAWVKPSGTMKTHTSKKASSQCEPYCVYAHPKHKISNLVWNEHIIVGEPYTKVMKNTGYIRDSKNQIDRSNSGAFTKDGYVVENTGTRRITNAIFAPNKPTMKHDERTMHPTQKPVELYKIWISWFTNTGGIVYEPFSGSGTAIATSDILQRTCYAMELSPDYLSMSLNRFIKDGLKVEKVFYANDVS